MISYWEKEALTSCDVAIIGGGIVGLSTAIELKEKNSSLKVMLLERGIFPSGASTKNAGFACFAKAAELLSDMKKNPAEEVAQLAYKRYLGLEKLRQRLGDEAMEFLQLGGHELLRGDECLTAGKIAELNELLKPYFKQDVFSERNDLISGFGFKGIDQLIHTPLEGQIHSGKMIDALWELASQLGVRIITGATLDAFEETGEGVICRVEHHILKELVEIKARKLVFCTNALAARFYPGLHITPGRGQVLVTEPVPGLRFSGTFHFDEGYYYFRNHGDRVLFGGGRNLDFERENTGEFEYNQEIQQKLDEYLQTMILPGQKIKTDMRWTGIMGFTPDKTPVVKALSSKRFIGFSCNGMGVALGSHTGMDLAGIITAHL